MSKKESWRIFSLRQISLYCLIIFSFGYTVNGQDDRPKAFAAPTGINALEVEGTNKAFFSKFFLYYLFH